MTIIVRQGSQPNASIVIRKPGELKLTDLKDVDVAYVQNNFVLTYDVDVSKWVAKPASTELSFVYDQANVALATATLAFNASNTAFIAASGAYAAANLSYDTANLAYIVAGSAFNQANLAYNAANTVLLISTSAFNQSNAVYNFANTLVRVVGGVQSNVISNSQLAASIVSTGLLNTSNVIEGANLYYTVDRANSAIDSRVTKAFVEALNITIPVADAAYNQANTAIVIGSNAFNQANLAFGQANTASISGGNAFARANVAYDRANTAVLAGTGAFAIANVAYDQSNTAVLIGSGAFGRANAAYDQANVALVAGTNAFARANTIYSFANTLVRTVAGVQSNTISNAQLAAGVESNGINWTGISNKPDPVITVILTGNVTGTGSATLTDVTSNTITIDTVVVGGGGGGGDVGPAFEQANAAYLQANTAVVIGTNAFNQANLAFAQANTALVSASNAFFRANSIYTFANTLVRTVAGVQSNVISNAQLAAGVESNGINWVGISNKPDPQITVTLTGDVTGTGSAVLSDVTSNTITIATVSVGGGGSGNAITAAYNQANAAYDQANIAVVASSNAFARANSIYNFANTLVRTVAGVQSNVISNAQLAAGVESNGINWTGISNKPDPVITVILTGNVTGTGSAILSDVTSNTITIDTVVVGGGGGGGVVGPAFDQANTATIFATNAFNRANIAFNQANTAVIFGSNAFGQANLAFIQANTAVIIGSNAFNQANLAFAQANTALVSASNAFALSNTIYTFANTLVRVVAGVQSNVISNAQLAAGVESNGIGWSGIINKPDPIITVILTGNVTGTGSATLTDVTSNTITIATTVVGGGGGGTVANSNITGNIIASQIEPTGVSAGTYGSATTVGKFTVDQQGRIVSASNVTISGGGGGGSPGGNDTEVQFNNEGAFDGVPVLTYAGGAVRVSNIANLRIQGGQANATIITDGLGNVSYTVSKYTTANVSVSTTLIPGVNMYLASGPITLTLPPASNNIGVVFLVKNINNSDVKVEGADPINGDTNIILQFKNSSLSLISDGSGWNIF